MGFIRDCFEEHGRLLMDELERAGFSVNQSIDFLPEVASGIASTFQILGVEKTTNNLVSSNTNQLLHMLNIDEIVQKTGLNLNQVKSGFKVVTPFFYNHFKKRMI